MPYPCNNFTARCSEGESPVLDTPLADPDRANELLVTEPAGSEAFVRRVDVICGVERGIEEDFGGKGTGTVGAS